MTTTPSSADLAARREGLLVEAARLLDRRVKLEAAVTGATDRIMAAIGSGESRERAESDCAKLTSELATVGLSLARLRQAVLQLDLDIPDAQRAEAAASLPALRKALKDQEGVVTDCERKLLALRTELGARARSVHAASLKVSAPAPRLHVRRTRIFETKDGEVQTIIRHESMGVEEAWAAVQSGAVAFEDETRQRLARVGGDHA